MKKIAVPQKLKKLVIDSLRRHCWNMGVSHYMGDILYMVDDKHYHDDFQTMADVNVDHRYLKANFRIYPATIMKWKKEGDAFIESVIAHEVAHILTDHLYCLATSIYKDEGEMQDARETLTEVIGRMSVKLDAALK